MIATIARDDDSYEVANLREYDVWGQIRAQGSLDSYGGPVMRYCANLGHQSDDESGLLFMRARYYEPWTGRFVSEDPSMDGINWFTYCGNDPISSFDFDGHTSRRFKAFLEFAFTAAGLFFIANGINTLGLAVLPATVAAGTAMIRQGVITMTFAYAAACTSEYEKSLVAAMIGYYLDGWLQSACAGLSKGLKTEAALACAAVFAYSLWLTNEIIKIGIDDMGLN